MRHRGPSPLHARIAGASVAARSVDRRGHRQLSTAIRRRHRMKLVRMLVLATTSAVVLSAIGGDASAGRLSIANSRWRALFATVELTGGFGTTRCAVTLEGSLTSRTVNKVRGLLM